MHHMTLMIVGFAVKIACMVCTYSIREKHTIAIALSGIWPFVGIQIKHEAKERQRMLQFHSMLWRIGYRRGTRHELFAGVRPCLSCACNGSFLSVVRYAFLLMFVGVAVCAAVQHCSFTVIFDTDICMEDVCKCQNSMVLRHLPC
jgi:hypothetical protein